LDILRAGQDVIVAYIKNRNTPMPLPVSLNGKLELPVLGSPLFIVSGPELVIAQCKAGIVGSFPALNARRWKSWMNG
jgi:hypothetical protein